MSRFLRRNAGRIAAVVVAVVCAWLTQLPTYGAAEQARLASAFAFTRLPLAVAAMPTQNVRAIEPSLRTISAWISAVGAAVSLSDLTGSGLSDDVCLVDPRSNSVTVAPAPSTGARYRPFLLDPNPLPYDRRTTAPMGCLPGRLQRRRPHWTCSSTTGDARLSFFLRRPGVPLGPERVRAARADDLPVHAGTPTRSPGRRRRRRASRPRRRQLLPGRLRACSTRAPRAIRACRCRTRCRVRRTGAPTGSSSGTRRAAARIRRSATRSRPARFRRAIADGWTLAVGAADLDGDLAARALLRQRLRPGPAALQPLDARARPASHGSTGVRGFTTPSSKVLGHDSFKGMGVDFGDLNGDGALDIVRQQHHRQYALLGEQLRLDQQRRDSRDARRGIAPYHDQSESLGLSRSGWALGREDRRLRQRRHARDRAGDRLPPAATSTAGPSCRSSRWRTTRCCTHAERVAALPAGRRPERPSDRGVLRPRRRPAAASNLAKQDRPRRAAASAAGSRPPTSNGDGAARHGGRRSVGTLLLVSEPLAAPRPRSSPCACCSRPAVSAERPACSTVTPASIARPAVGAEARVVVAGRAPLVAQVDGGNGHASVRRPELHLRARPHGRLEGRGQAGLARRLRSHSPEHAATRAGLAHGRSRTREPRMRRTPREPKQVASARPRCAGSASRSRRSRSSGAFFLGFEDSWAQPVVALVTAYVLELCLETIEAWANRPAAALPRRRARRFCRLPAPGAHHGARDRAAPLRERELVADRVRDRRRRRLEVRVPRAGRQRLAALPQPVELRHRVTLLALPVGRRSLRRTSSPRTSPASWDWFLPVAVLVRRDDAEREADREAAADHRLGRRVRRPGARAGRRRSGPARRAASADDRASSSSSTRSTWSPTRARRRSSPATRSSSAPRPRPSTACSSALHVVFGLFFASRDRVRRAWPRALRALQSASGSRTRERGG